ncbi:MAG: hypothetical protein ACRDE7_00945 [Sphingobacterium sp.]
MKLAGTRLIVVLGHSRFGAIKDTCKGVKLGHLTNLHEKINPSTENIKENHNTIDATSVEGINLLRLQCRRGDVD